MVFRIGSLLDPPGLGRLRAGNNDDLSLHCGAGLDINRRRCWVCRPFVSHREVERVPAQLGGWSVECDHRNHDAQLSVICGSRNYINGWNNTDRRRHLSVGCVERYAISGLGMVTCQWISIHRSGWSVAEQLANREPLLPWTLYRH